MQNVGYSGRFTAEQAKGVCIEFTHMGFVNRPETFLQFRLSPPQIPHLSNFLLEPNLPSHPALMHFPWTQTEEESGEQGVPSTTCGGRADRISHFITFFRDATEDL